MNLARTSATPNVDLRTTRRRLLFAREQVAANTRTEHYLAIRAMRHWAPVAHDGGTGDGSAGTTG